jgi:hypothetical protein
MQYYSLEHQRRSVAMALFDARKFGSTLVFILIANAKKDNNSKATGIYK